MPTAERTWRNLGAREGLYVLVHSERGGQIRVATHDDANNLVLILNSLEESSAFGQQCYQDRCENAYVEASVVKRLQSTADTLTAQRDALIAACKLAAGQCEHAEAEEAIAAAIASASPS